MKTVAKIVALTLCFAILSMPRMTLAQNIKLIVRGDDMGMSQGSLVAFERAFNQGVLTCGSIIVPGPWFEGAAELCRKNPGWCTGVHLCLVGEWRGARWRPVLPWDKVSSIVDQDGYLYTYPGQLFANKPKLEEIEAELRAQIELAKKKGVNVQYIDTHYMSPKETGYPGLNEIIKKIGQDYNVPVSGLLDEQGIGIYTVPVEEKKDSAVGMLDKLEPGLWLWVCHPGIDSPEQRALIHTDPQAIFVEGGVGRHRAEILNTLTSLELKSIILKKGIQLTNYRELWKEKHSR
ncbi:MAG TPA: ChbG/HpnK family deacetylase [archaeon]|nr:ChbG/HpnK family deacetylase [archaeon]